LTVTKFTWYNQPEGSREVPVQESYAGICERVLCRYLCKSLMQVPVQVNNIKAFEIQGVSGS